MLRVMCPVTTIATRSGTPANHVPGRGATQVMEELVWDTRSLAGGRAFEVWESIMWGLDPKSSARLGRLADTGHVIDTLTTAAVRPTV
jgi:hypothetical protein